MRILWMLLLANLCDLASDFEGCDCAVGIGYGDFGFAGTEHPVSSISKDRLAQMILFMVFLLQFNAWVSKVDHGFATAFG